MRKKLITSKVCWYPVATAELLTLQITAKLLTYTTIYSQITYLHYNLQPNYLHYNLQCNYLLTLQIIYNQSKINYT